MMPQEKQSRKQQVWCPQRKRLLQVARYGQAELHSVLPSLCYLGSCISSANCGRTSRWNYMLTLTTTSGGLISFSSFFGYSHFGDSSHSPKILGTVSCFHFRLHPWSTLCSVARSTIMQTSAKFGGFTIPM